MRELAEAAESVTGRKPPFFTSPLWMARASAPVMEVLAGVLKKPPLYTRESIQVLGDNDDFDITKARTELGHAPRPLKDSLQDAYAWFKEAGMLD